MAETEIVQSPMYGIIADLVKNNKNLTPDLQNAIARFIEIESTPIITMADPSLEAIS